MERILTRVTFAAEAESAEVQVNLLSERSAQDGRNGRNGNWLSRGSEERQ